MKSSRANLNNSGFAGILVIPLALIIVGLVAFILFQNSNIFKTPPEDTPDKTPQAQTKWKTYTNDKVGFSFKYPDTVLFESQSEASSQSELLVSVDKLTDIPEDLPSFMGRTDALKEKTLLESGESQSAIKVGAYYANVGMRLSQFEVCSVILNRTLTFYPGDYRVIITLMGPQNAIMDSMPEFFVVDENNCGENRMWNQDTKSDFTSTLAQKQGQGAGQEWYDTFDAIAQTLTISAPLSTATPVPVSTMPASWTTFKSDKYGFEIAYPPTYKALSSKDDLYGYPKGIVLLYEGGQAYDVVIEAWNTEAEYKNEYGARVSDITAFKINGKVITILNNTNEPENKDIIDSFKLLQ